MILETVHGAVGEGHPASAELVGIGAIDLASTATNVLCVFPAGQVIFALKLHTETSQLQTKRPSSRLAADAKLRRDFLSVHSEFFRDAPADSVEAVLGIQRTIVRRPKLDPRAAEPAGASIDSLRSGVNLAAILRDCDYGKPRSSRS